MSTANRKIYKLFKSSAAHTILVIIVQNVVLTTCLSKMFKKLDFRRFYKKINFNFKTNLQQNSLFFETLKLYFLLQEPFLDLYMVFF